MKIWLPQSTLSVALVLQVVLRCGGAAAAAATAVPHDVEFKHHNNTELASVLQRVHNKCPDITRLYTLSEPSVNGIPLYVLEISDMPGKHELRK